jgi:hypothetical protein
VTIGIAVIIIFLIAAVLMFLRKLPALLALPLMALAIAFIEVVAGRISLNDVSLAIVADGSVRLMEPIVISLFGGMLSFLMQKSGVAENFIKRGAELGGDNPVVLSIIMLAVIGLLFTTIGGLGAVIMVAAIVLPILASVGVREYISGGIFLIGISMGGVLNANNWMVYRTVLQLDIHIVSGYALVILAILVPVSLSFIVIELWRTGLAAFRLKHILMGIGTIVVLGGVYLIGRLVLEGFDFAIVVRILRWLVALVGATILTLAVLDIVKRWRQKLPSVVRWYAYLIPLVPLVLILLFDVHVLTAFILGMVYGFIVTFRNGSLNMLVRSIIEGASSVMPAVILMIGIGILLSTILGPTPTGPAQYWYKEHLSTATGAAVQVPQPEEWPVLADMKPLFENIVPHSLIGFVLVFTLLGPLALYRGPLNVWGLGYGIAGILLSSGLLPAPAIMGVLMSSGVIQGICDPTNTHNVWLANELKTDVQTLMWRTLPYAWFAAFVGLLIAGLKYLT